MNITHLNELKELEEGYWWHVAKRRLLTDYLKSYFPPPAKILEVGVGAGGNLIFLKTMGYEVRGFDIMPEAVQYCRESGLDEVSVHDISKPWPVDSESFDVVVMMDVLEHVDRQLDALNFAKKAIASNGGLVVSVPACPYLMGPWDLA